MTLYQKLKASGNPQAVAQITISLLESHSVKETAKILGVTPRWVYKLRERFRLSNDDISACIKKRGPKFRMPNRTPEHIENLVVTLAKETNLGSKRLALFIKNTFNIQLSPFTIRNIRRRYGIRCRKHKTLTGSRRFAADFSAFEPLQFWQIDAKHIADQSALPPEAYASIFKNKLPLFQFTAIDIKTRLRFIAYADSLDFKNGLTFMLLVVAWLRAFGVKHQLFFQTDNGAEFGGSAGSRKRSLIQKLIFDNWNVSLLNIPERNKETNCFVERSHRTDDEEFYALNLKKVTSRTSFLNMAQNWILYFNYRRPHFGKNMNGMTPVEALKFYRCFYHPAIGSMPVVVLDQLSNYTSLLFDISSLPWDNLPRNKKLLNETMAHYIFKYFVVIL